MVRETVLPPQSSALQAKKEQITSRVVKTLMIERGSSSMEVERYICMVDYLLAIA